MIARALRVGFVIAMFTVLHGVVGHAQGDILHGFAGYPTDGSEPVSFSVSLVQGLDGTLYGTTKSGGSADLGTVFSIAPDGSAYSVLYSFTGSDGSHPMGGLIQGSDGMLYGTTYGIYGIPGTGTIFRIAPDGSGFTVIYSFDDSSATNARGLLQGLDSMLYGATVAGGSGSCDGGCGTIFKIATDGSGFTILYTFTGPDGAHPYGGLIQGPDGTLYGTTSSGGPFEGHGTIFKIATDGSSFSQIYFFFFGFAPASLIQGVDGMLYGTTGGSYGGDSFICGDTCGAVLRIAPDGSGIKGIHEFRGPDGLGPGGLLLQGLDGMLYGTTVGGGSPECELEDSPGCGTVFRVAPDGSSFTQWYVFTGPDGSNPEGGLIQGPDGVLHGTTRFGGPGGLGVVF
jgi:uncharacterized repeat protein (TIGR03803 family)